MNQQPAMNINNNLLQLNTQKERNFLSNGDTSKILIDNERIRLKYNQLFTENKTDDMNNQMYSFGCKFNYGYEYEWGNEHAPVDAISVFPKYCSLKEELMMNEISIVSIHQFNAEFEKAKTHYRSQERKRNKKWATMSIQHILSLMMYCNFTTLQYNLRKTYRVSKYKHHNEFYFMGKYLKQAVNEFGTKVSTGKVKSFYHGISKKLLFPDCIGIYIYAPLSTSSSVEVAMNFTDNNNGLVIQFKPKSRFKYFSCEWLSNFANESERLFIQSYEPLQIHHIFGADLLSQKQQNIPEKISIKLSKKLTKSTIPKYIKEKYMNEQLRDLYDYMNKYLMIHGNAVMKDFNIDNTTIKIINYNFHNQTNDILYVICDKQYKSNNIDFEWKMKHNLFTETEIKHMYKISKQQLPNTYNIIPTFTAQLQQQTLFENMLKNANKRNNMIKKTKWSKVPIFNSKTSKIKLSAQLTKEEFIKRVKSYADKNTIRLIPIVSFDEDKYCVKFIWIIQIDTCMTTNIGIILDLTNDNKNITAKGIYLDIYDQHKLVPYEHECNCLDNFQSTIHELEIGAGLKNKIQQLEQHTQSLKQKLMEQKNEIESLKKLIAINENINHYKTSTLNNNLLSEFTGMVDSWWNSNLNNTDFKDVDCVEVISQNFASNETI